MDATIIHAPCSTKSSTGTRAPETRQTKTGDRGFFGMKAHMGVDFESSLARMMVATPANTADVKAFPPADSASQTLRVSMFG